MRGEPKGINIKKKIMVVSATLRIDRGKQMRMVLFSQKKTKKLEEYFVKNNTSVISIVLDKDVSLKYWLFPSSFCHSRSTSRYLLLYYTPFFPLLLYFFKTEPSASVYLYFTTSGFITVFQRKRNEIGQQKLSRNLP